MVFEAIRPVGKLTGFPDLEGATMITVEEATALIRSHCSAAEVVTTSIADLKSEVLQEELLADTAMPPFDRVAMDGIAISYSAWKNGSRSFTVEGVQAAGMPVQTLRDNIHCLEVMTGAVLPIGCDTVIRVEDIQLQEGMASLIEGLKIQQFSNIHKQGSDYQPGDLLVEKGRQMFGPQWAVAATIGKSEVKVSKRPRIAIVSTGDELVDVTETPQPHQIRRSNSYAMAATLGHLGFDYVSQFHLTDDRKNLLVKLGEILSEFDFVLLSGGVSMGKFDFVPSVLADLNVKKIFHKIAQKPGKPMWFGVGPQKQMVFGLPGNPVSALICLNRYVVPALWDHLGLDTVGEIDGQRAILSESVEFKSDKTLFKPIRVLGANRDSLKVVPVKVNGSGDLASLAKADGFVELPGGSEIFKAGESFPVWLWRK